MKQWTTGELARERDISVRTLRYYDQIGLLTPSFKDANGKRYYSEDDFFELEKIMILKSIALPLEDIRSVLDQLSYKQILISHYHYLQEQLVEVQNSISNTTSLINMIELEETLRWEDVTKRVRHSQQHSKRWLDHFPEDEQAFLKNVLPNLSHNDASTQQWIALLKRIEWCIDNNIQPESEEGLQIAAELMELSDHAFQGNEELGEKFWEIRKRPAEETGLYPISDEVLAFVERCMAGVST